MNLQGKIALITGASSGVGEGVARALAAKGAKVGFAARRIYKQGHRQIKLRIQELQ